MTSDADIAAVLRRVTGGLPGGGETRPGQARMAQAVARAIGTGRHLVVQAGTGTGKSLAYLVPALAAGRPVVVATATKALQDQLAGKDLPFLARRLGRRVDFAVMKGRANYICRQRLREMDQMGEQLDLGAGEAGEVGRQVRRLVEWAAESSTGERSELDFEPRPQAWSAVSVTASDCPGAANCPSGDTCFAEAARRRAADADVVVVNTHLYGAHLASAGAVIPEHDLVVFDEAHELEDVAAATLGLEIGPGRLRFLSRAYRDLPGVRDAAEGLLQTTYRYDDALRHLVGRRLTGGLGGDLGPAVDLAGARLAAFIAAVRAVDAGVPARARALQAATHLAADFGALAKLGDDQVAWVEGPDHSPVLRTAAVDVGAPLAERLWGHVTAVLTSATVPPGLAARIGLPPDNTDELDVGSPFPYGEAALLYCAAHLPDPRRAGAEKALHEELEALITTAGGRTLALFTSWRAMRAAADVVGPRLPYRVLTQADLPKPALLAAFRDDESSCLFATLGFFQGVDIPGRTLSLVTIDRIPFPRPDDPLTQARRERAGPTAFRTVDVPRAATLLAQGAGRLIRAAGDRGVVAVLDPRLATASYRWDLVRAMPPMRRTRHRHKVAAFLQSATRGEAAAGTAAVPSGGTAAGTAAVAAAAAAGLIVSSPAGPEPSDAAASPDRP